VLLWLVVCSPTPRVIWTRLARPLDDRFSMPADQFGQELVIRDVRLEDAGHYQCSASNSVGSPVTHVITLIVHGQSTISHLATLLCVPQLTYTAPLSRMVGWLGSRVVSVLDSGTEGPGFKSQSRRCRVTVLSKLFIPIVPLFTKQQNR